MSVKCKRVNHARHLQHIRLQTEQRSCNSSSPSENFSWKVHQSVLKTREFYRASSEKQTINRHPKD